MESRHSPGRCFGSCARCSEAVYTVGGACKAMGQLFHNKCFTCSTCSLIKKYKQLGVIFCAVIVVLCLSITVWFGSSTKQDRSKLQPTIRSAEKTMRAVHPSILDLYSSRVRKRSSLQTPHSLDHKLFRHLPSNCRYLLKSAATESVCPPDKQLKGQPFFTVSGHIYCEDDFLFAGVHPSEEVCHSCGSPIPDLVLQARGKSYHPTCFRCVVCRQELQGQPFAVDSDSRVYCVTDYHRVQSPLCGACMMPILPTEGSAESIRVASCNKYYHVECYSAVLIIDS